MTTPKDYKLSFSQREGKAPLPEPMRLQHLPVDFRNLVWHAVDLAITRNKHSGDYYKDSASIRDIFIDYYVRIHQLTHDSHPDTPSKHRSLLKGIIIEGTYHGVLTLVEFILCHGLCDEELRQSLLAAFASVPVAYTVQTLEDLPTIVPRASEESGAATQQAIETIEDKGPAGAKAHLRKAVKAINEKRLEDAVRESIHAVEAVARTIAPDTRALGPALDSLERQGVLKHAALRTAFDKLYGYTSDEKGIRHSLLDQEKADVDLDDAIFMFAACAAFAAYLVNRNEQVRQTGDTRKDG